MQASESAPKIVEVQSNSSEFSIADFVGDYSVYGTCPEHDWNTGILRISEDYVSMTETGCRIATTSTRSAGALLLDLTECHAEGEAMPNERAKLTTKNGINTLQYLPNADGIQRGDGRVFEFTACSRDVDQ